MSANIMSILPIRIIPDSVLRQVAEPVAVVDDAVRKLLDDMLETMYDAPGIGLAAPQIGVLKRLVVLDVAHREREIAKGETGEHDASETDDDDVVPVKDRRPKCLVNPEITWSSEELRSYTEGCLSIPDYYEDVVRPARVRVTYLDRNGERQEEEAEGIYAICLQHEIDHLNGVLFIDHLSKLKRDRVNKKFAKLARRG
jgi:peptide deformylase